MEDLETWLSGTAIAMDDTELGPVEDFMEHFDFAKENTFCRLIDRKGAEQDMPRDEQMQKLQAFLDDSPKLANCSSDYDLRYMSALERAVDNVDIELVRLLLARGADPNRNCYTGEIPTMASHYGYEDPRFMEAYPLGRLGFSVPENERTIPGFPGLYPLCDPEACDEEWRERCLSMQTFLKQYRLRHLMKQFRAAVSTRRIAFYWLGQATQTACDVGAASREADRDAFTADFYT